MKNKTQKTKYRKLNARFNALDSFCTRLFTFNFRHSTRAYARGVATLPTVMLLGVMSLIVAVGITTLAFTELLISQGGSQSSRALFYAEAGARDALIKIARNKNYTCATADCYMIDFSTNGCSLGNDCAKVAVSAGVGTVGDPKIIISKGTMKASTRTMQVSVVMDTYGQIATSTTSTVWTEI